MIGCRPLTWEEIEAVSSILSARDKAMFILGCRTGFRVSELLCLQLKDVRQGNRIKEEITVSKRNMKGKAQSRTIYVQKEAREALKEYIDGNEHINAQSFLFWSRKDWTKAISRVQAYRILKEAFNACSLQGKLATHSMRKTFAWMIWDASVNNLALTSAAMGHTNVNSTMSYINVTQVAVTSLLKSLER